MNETQKINILLVDDRQENLLSLEALLEGPDLNIFKATSGNEALGLTLQYDFALVLLDVQMPDMDGFETAELMRGNRTTRHVPIIFITAISKEQKHLFKGYETGAVDYLFKPIDPDILKSKVKVFIDLQKQKVALKRTHQDLKQTVMELKRANRRILEQQKKVIEDERLKVLLQMAGATAHELNQPLMTLLGSIELMKLSKDIPKKLTEDMDRIEGEGRRISDIVKRIQIIQHDEVKPYLDGPGIINFDQKVNILSVEDSDSDFKIINQTVKDNNQIALSRASNINDAVNNLRKDRIDLILLNHVLPDGTSLDFLKTMEQEKIETPVVVITGQGDEAVASTVIRKGAYDYLSKARISQKSLFRCVHNAMEKYRLKKEVKLATKKMAEMATIDELTGLYNRRYFMENLDREIDRAKRYGAEFFLCMLDLDYFKKINDKYGHSGGDIVLSEVGRMLRESMRQSDMVCRYGGEKFTVILPNTPRKKALAVCERFREKVAAHQFQHNSSEYHCTVSIGIVLYNPELKRSFAEIVEMADRALYQAKEEGRDLVVELMIDS